LAKNTTKLVTLFALTNLWMTRRRLLTHAGELRLKCRKWLPRGAAAAKNTEISG
jgi:hypothetical protein